MKDFSPIISPLCLVRPKGLSWTAKHRFYVTISSDAPLIVPEEPTMRKRTKEKRKKSSTWWDFVPTTSSSQGMPSTSQLQTLPNKAQS